MGDFEKNMEVRHLKRHAKLLFWDIMQDIFATDVIDEHKEEVIITPDDVRAMMKEFMDSHDLDFDEEWLREIDAEFCAYSFMHATVGSEEMGEKYSWPSWCCDLVGNIRCKKDDPESELRCLIKTEELKACEEALAQKTDISLAELRKQQLEEEIQDFRETYRKAWGEDKSDNT